MISVWRSSLVCWMFWGWYWGYQEYSLHCQSDSVCKFGCILHISGSDLDSCYVSGGRCAGPCFFSIYTVICRLPFSRWPWCLRSIQRQLNDLWTGVGNTRNAAQTEGYYWTFANHNSPESTGQGPWYQLCPTCNKNHSPQKGFSHQFLVHKAALVQQQKKEAFKLIR